MKLILLKEVDNLGEEGDIVTVKDGYGRNYLIPQGLALMATPGTIKARQEELRQAARKRAQAQEEAERLAQELQNTEVVVYAKVGEENRIFGTVTPTQVADQLARQGFVVDRRNVTLPEDIRMLGVYTAQVKVHPKVTAQVKVRVENEAEAS
ncbi:MAG: 50S ribosomal protein L9 [Bacteroidetes bacterium]|nr:50S ribosomal protein L9 [Rhodothermaceae bacterium RA]RMH61045.1 MAG: 50S ribosomal protein L9 [Bacteroidota bacterium]